MSAENAMRAGGRLRALIRKEFSQIRRDKRLAVSLIVPPTLQILLFGFALDATVSNLRLGVVDWSRTPESRELVSSFTESKSFRLGGYYTAGGVSMRASWSPTNLRAKSGAAGRSTCRFF
jgi:hypothetical protein